jgi:hypothetical protein
MFGKKARGRGWKALIGLTGLTDAPWPNAVQTGGIFPQKKIGKCPVRFLELGENPDLLRKRASRSVRETFKDHATTEKQNPRLYSAG